ncbi:MAG: hypothetical protein KDA57_13990 [Planctomycetales bacterium]|nr:hypothetical protein [Planctomycetales bacterium]
MTSYHEDAHTIQDFHAALLKHAAEGRCLFGGRLTTPLNNESRAGKTLKAERTWIVFDFDKVEAKDHADVVAKYLPPECQNVSYVAQSSASMYRTDTTLWSGHIFMLLKTPTDEQRVKQWFEWLNFNVPALSSQISLSDSLQALHWPLDRSTAYNSKLIYIAPPKCVGFEPAVTTPFELVKKRGQSFDIPAFTPLDSVSIRQRINDLRRAAGESEIDYVVRAFEGNEVLMSASECSVHGIKASGDHYIRFNLNGGDSYAYFIDLRAPELIRNFKGEPYLRTEDAAPDLWKALRSKASQIVQKQPLDDGAEVLAFYATNRGSKIHIGVYSPIASSVVLNQSTETAARAWLAEFGMLQKGFLPHYDMEFNPKSDVQYVPGCTTINTFHPTKYMAKSKNKKPSSAAELPPVIAKVLNSVLGDPDNALLDHFLNWLACIMQFRSKTGSAWVLWGRTGTGKGTLARYVLRPLIGTEHVRNIQVTQLQHDFNHWLEGTLLAVIEEADTRAVDNSAELHMKLKHYIADSPLEINQKGVTTYESDNYTNFILYANETTPAIVTRDDRRYNIPARQEKELHLTPNEYISIVNGDELDAFADVLMRWPASEAQASRIIKTEAHKDAHEASTPINQLIAEAILAGDLQFFIDRTPTAAEALADFHNRFNPMGQFNVLIDKYVEDAAANRHSIVEEPDLFVLFRTLIPDSKFFQDSKTWRRRHFKSLGLKIDEQHRHPDDYKTRARGVIVKWSVPTYDERKKPEAPADDSIVVPLTKKRKPR